MRKRARQRLNGLRSIARSIVVAYVEAAPWKQRGLAFVSALGGLYLAWRAFLARGSRCSVEGPPGIDFTQDLVASCTPEAWQAWWRWPGLVVGLAVTGTAFAALVHARRARLAAQGRKGRRTREFRK
jgi:hypothetical protein